MSTKNLIAPSILSADRLNLQRDVQQADKAGADLFHIDLMDGVFVPNLSFGPDFITALHQITELPLDAHLMVAHPEQYLQIVAQAGVSLINVHVESTNHIYRLVQQIHELKAQAGIVLNPGTSVASVISLLDIVDNVLVMTVNPGFGGQQFIPQMLDKVQYLAQLRHDNLAYTYSIEVDGGVNNQTIIQCQQAGANIFVAGSYVFDHDIAQQIRKLKQAINHEKQYNLLLGGTLANLPDLTTISGSWIGIDHGTLILLDMGITPLISVGDFDSLAPAERQRMEATVADIRYSNPIKDYTDSQMGVKIALQDLQANQVDIYGATGGRLDHELVNIFLPLDLTVDDDIPKICLVDRQNVITYFTPGTYEIVHLPKMKYLGFFNLTAVQQLEIKDAKYQLSATDLQRPVSLSSNEFVQETVHFKFASGIVAVIQSKD